MEFILPLATLAVAQLMAVISPGQSFLVVSRTALASGRSAALTATLGMGIGSVFWAGSAMAGLAVLFQQAAWIYIALKIAAGLYLLFLAINLWWHADDKMDVGQAGKQQLHFSAALRLGFLTQIANPKVIVFFGSIFVALLPAQPPLWVMAATLAIVFVNETGWYAIVSCLFSATKSRDAYLRAKPWVDRGMAGLLALIGGKLIVDAR
ncbi:MAG: LysE family translocator [Alphaproteobacteria bacterium]|nr:LysE family translocator [Alphaproteobacteria bacterium]